jgi:hypothetical protein
LVCAVTPRPTESTLCRALARVDGDHLDAVIRVRRITQRRTEPTPTDLIGMNGTILHGTVSRTGGAGVHLLSAVHPTAEPLWRNDSL